MVTVVLVEVDGKVDVKFFDDENIANGYADDQANLGRRVKVL